MAAGPKVAMRAVTRMVARLASVAITQATSPTARMRPNSARLSGARKSGTNPAPPRSTTKAMISAEAVMLSAKAMPAPGKPSPSGSMKAQASGGKISHPPTTPRAARACRPPPRRMEAKVLAIQAGSAPAPKVQAA